MDANRQFIAWVREYSPELLATATARLAAPMGAAQADTNFFSKLVNNISQLAEPILKNVQLVREVNTNYQRAKDGLPPIDFKNPASQPYYRDPEELTVTLKEPSTSSRWIVAGIVVAGGFLFYSLLGSKNNGR